MTFCNLVNMYEMYSLKFILNENYADRQFFENRKIRIPKKK